MRAIVLLSGGIDSTVALAEAIAAGRECSCLCFSYGQRAWINELESASAIARHYKTQFAQCHIDAFFWKGESFLTGGSDVAHSVVPARNMLLIAHGVAAAEAQGASEVWIGCNLNDALDYPDCTGDFVRSMSQAASYATSGVTVAHPHALRSKADVIRRGLELDVPLHMTTSCADGSGRCGVCKACALRRQAYAEIGTSDSVVYLG